VAVISQQINGDANVHFVRCDIIMIYYTKKKI